MNKASIFMTTSWIGLAGLAIALPGLVLSGVEAVTLIGMIVAVLAAIAMLWARKADEYTNGLWNAGASVAFGALLSLVGNVELLKMDPLPNRKTDINDGGPFSTDFIGFNWDYPAGVWSTLTRMILYGFCFTEIAQPTTWAGTTRSLINGWNKRRG